MKNRTYIYKTLFLVMFCFSTLGCSSCRKTVHFELPKAVKNHISKIEYGKLGHHQPEVQYEVLSDSLVKVSLTWMLKDTLRQDDWQVNIYPGFTPEFHWSPHLTPTDEHIIAQHVFRSPALIVASKEQQLSIIPDIDLLNEEVPVDWYMDLNAIDNKLTLGLSKSEVKEHVLYTRKSGAVYPPGKVEFGFYIMMEDKPDALFNPWRDILSFFWERWGRPLHELGEPLHNKNLEPYIKHTYNWAFNNWKKSVWQEFNLNGKKVGAPVFIVNVTRSPNFSGEPKNREFISIWNQAWFSSLRSAQGLYRYAKRENDKQLEDYAMMTKELALSFPQRKGFFYSVIAPETERVEKNGQVYDLAKGWDEYYFGNSNRNPYTGDARKSPFHILDMSFTAFQMLTWYDEMEKDKRLLDYATLYADALIKIQDEEGFFPGWLSIDSLKPLLHLNQSPETSMSVTFLLKLYEVTGEEQYLQPALKAMQAVIDNIIPVGRWEDFETYWSCSRYGADNLVNEKVERNNMYKQNNFSMYWTAEALLSCYEVTGKKKYLENGQRTLDEMLMTQASWQPPYMYVNTLGGFGVMNADGEWNDSRQSLFSELIVKYGKELDNPAYIQRGLAALRASFVMMYCPENPKTKEQWEKRWDFFGKEDYGFMMENYGHGGTSSATGVGIGEFTIYDWGNGAAAEAYNRMLDHYGKEFMLNN
jgi:hypothetical protein